MKTSRYTTAATTGASTSRMTTPSMTSMGAVNLLNSFRWSRPWQRSDRVRLGACLLNCAEATPSGGGRVSVLASIRESFLSSSAIDRI